MKVFLKNLIPILLLTILFTCNNDDSTTTEQDSFISKKNENRDINGISANYQNSIFLEGKFKTMKPTKNQFVIYTETQDTRHIFLFSEVDKSFNLNKKIEKLSYLKNGILLNNDLFLGVKGNINETINRDIKTLAKNNNIKRLDNFKVLIYRWFSKDDADFKDISINNLVNETSRLATLPHEGDCDAGGEGATACSVGGGATGCSVSCGAGYYACCNVTGMGVNDCHCDEINNM